MFLDLDGGNSEKSFARSQAFAVRQRYLISVV